MPALLGAREFMVDAPTRLSLRTRRIHGFSGAVSLYRADHAVHQPFGFGFAKREPRLVDIVDQQHRSRPAIVFMWAMSLYACPRE